VQAIASQGALARVTIDCGFALTALVTRSALSELNLATGTSVKAAFKAGSVHLVSRR
jgi:molybdate transport system ATP-binding protein